MISLCTLFDKNYLSRGLALIHSVQTHHAGEYGFRLFVLALDDEAERVVTALDDDRIRVDPLNDVMTYELHSARSNRSWTEFCWTLASHWIKHCQREFDQEEIAYIDADMFLLHPLDALYREVAQASIAITPHRFSKARAATHGINGTFNVGWVYFKNDAQARACLDEWASLCAAWCYQRSEQDSDGNWRFGDQGYWDQLVPKYGVHAVKNIGTNLAPWNMGNYEYQIEVGAGAKAGEPPRLFVIERNDCGGVVRIDTANLFHFHSLQEKRGRIVKHSDYPIPPILAREVYAPYEATLLKVSNRK